MIDVGIVLFENIGLLAFVAVAYTIVPRRWPRIPHSAMVGLLCGFGAILAMLKPIEMGNGVILDTRGTMIMLSGMFGGPIGALIATLIGSAMRIYLGGLGVPSGVAWIAVTGLVSSIGYRLVRPDGAPLTQKSLAIFALLTPLCSVTVLLLPWTYVVTFVTETMLPLSIAQIIGIYALGTIMLHEDERVAAETKVRTQAVTDELSRLPNRRAFYARLAEEWQRTTRYQVPFCVLMVDIDHFKAVNDRFGHKVGDAVIAHLGTLLRDSCRTSDLPARIGGEEFAILLTHTDIQAATLLAERIRKQIEASDCTVENQRIPYTVSVGVSSSDDFPLSPDEIMSAADSALYESKRGGRNRVSLASADLNEAMREVNCQVAVVTSLAAVKSKRAAEKDTPASR